MNDDPRLTNYAELTAELVEEDRPVGILYPEDAPAALDEEREAPQLTRTEMPANNPVHRRLRAIAGADVPYVFLTFSPDNGGQVSIDFWGIDPADLSPALATVSAATQM